MSAVPSDRRAACLGMELALMDRRALRSMTERISGVTPDPGVTPRDFLPDAVFLGVSSVKLDGTSWVSKA